MINHFGCLFSVSTPIGNLHDLSLRSIQTIRLCSCIACENKSIVCKIFHYINCYRQVMLYKNTNEIFFSKKIIDKILTGQNVALICDAGTPSISDPGFRIIRECRRRSIQVIPVPGPTAAIAALSASGLPTNGFLFIGFLSFKKNIRMKFFKTYSNFNYTILFYESCHRTIGFIQDLVSVIGQNRIICVAREITKIHESFYIGTVKEVLALLGKSIVKGEIVIIISSRKFKL